MSNQERRGPPPEVAAATAARMAAHARNRQPAQSTSLALPSASVDLDQVRADAAAAERTRILDIMSSPEARANPALAMELAYKQNRPASEALATLRVFGGAGGSPQAGSHDDIDASWATVADRLNAQAGHSGANANVADDPWADTVKTVNRESGR